MKTTIRTTLAILAATALSAVAQYPGRSMTVGVTNLMLLPPSRPITTNTWWASTAYSQGSIIQDSNTVTKFYWSVVGGTSSNVPPTWAATNDVVEAGGPTWRLINSQRGGFTVGHTGNGLLYLGLSYPAVAGRGVTLYGSQGYSEDSSYALYGVYSVGSTAVWIQEK